jgi:hypothetical protein
LQFRPWLQSFQQNFGDVSNSKKAEKNINVKKQQRSFTKKATGRINISLQDGHLIERAIQESLQQARGRHSG